MDTINRIAQATRRFSVLLKAAFIAGLVLVLLVPLVMVQSMVAEREGRRAGVEEEIISSRGGEQAVGGPVLTVPVVVRSKDAEGRVIESIERVHLLPDTLALDGTVDTERRRRGIYEAVTYDTTLHVSGSFTVPDPHPGAWPRCSGRTRSSASSCPTSAVSRRPSISPGAMPGPGSTAAGR